MPRLVTFDGNHACLRNKLFPPKLGLNFFVIKGFFPSSYFFLSLREKLEQQSTEVIRANLGEKKFRVFQTASSIQVHRFERHSTCVEPWSKQRRNFKISIQLMMCVDNHAYLLSLSTIKILCLKSRGQFLCHTGCGKGSLVPFTYCHCECFRLIPPR